MEDHDSWNGRPALAYLVEKEEDRFTLLLRELLQSPEVLEVFLHDVCNVQIPGSARDLRVDVQVHVPGGIADLVISGDRVRMIFEAKVSSWLRGTQMAQYLAALPRSESGDGKVSGLFVIAPAANLASLCKEATAQLSAKEFSYQVRGVAWQTVAGVFEDLAPRLRNNELRAHLRTFVDLVRCRLGDADEPFGTEEISLLSDSLTGRAVKRIYLTYNRIVDALRTEKDIKVTNSSGERWQGRTLRSGGRWWWFGIWPEVWAEMGGSPLVLQLPMVTSESLLFGDLTAVPIRVPAGTGSAVTLGPSPMESPSLAAVRITAEILRVVRELSYTGGGPGTPSPPEEGAQ